jgi:hypothetical protein
MSKVQKTAPTLRTLINGSDTIRFRAFTVNSKETEAMFELAPGRVQRKTMQAHYKRNRVTVCMNHKHQGRNEA